jgi:hypothetical protein
MKFITLALCLFAISAKAQKQDSLLPEKSALKFSINSSGSRYIQVTLMNQVWVRWNENNSGTTRFSEKAPSTFDLGLRRTRIQLFGQITDHAFVYFQFGQNNYSNTFNIGNNRKNAAFFHDAVCEYKISTGNALKIGGGLTVMNGLSRFSQPSVSSIMTLDVPVFLQYSVDQVDQFDRRLAVYARGQIGKLDYRVYAADPFPINSNGGAAPPLTENASFVNATLGSKNSFNKQFGGYLTYNFLEMEPHTTPYMAGTYLGKKKVWNVSIGGVYQKNATWFTRRNEQGQTTDTAYANMVHVGVETFYDSPLQNGDMGALNFFAGFYLTDYGKNYLRYNGSMNPATGSTATNQVQSSSFGNAYPMFGTGNVLYMQSGWLLPAKFTDGMKGRLMAFISVQFADYDELQHHGMLVYDAGINWLLKEHQAKISLDFQNRPEFVRTNGNIRETARHPAVILQLQHFF